MLTRTTQIKLKYVFDRLAALVLLVLLAPLLGLIALAIKLYDGGNVFFRQKRLGLDGKPFVIWKFRTMVPDADKLLDAEGRVGNVNRVTRIGQLLRSLSLDELPQLTNIVKGEMSFVGPRPTPVQLYARYTARQKGRLRAKPGITGLAQISGRNTLKWSQRIECDLRYIEDYSLLLDLIILAKTPKVVIFREGIVQDRNPEQVDDLGPAEPVSGGQEHA